MGDARAWGNRARIFSAALVAATVIVVAGCAPAPVVEPTPTPTVTEAAPVDTSTLRTMIDAPASAPELVLGDPAPAIAGETAVLVSYDSGGTNVTGVLRTPAGDGPRPAVVAVHGSVDPADYQPGGDLIAEQRALLEAGYTVLAVDMRGYAGSDPADTSSLAIDPNFGWTTYLDWGMALDVVNALLALRSGQVEGVDPERVGLVGHSLGGLLAIDAAVIAPGAADLVVALSAPTSDLGGLIQQYMDSGEADELFTGSASPPEDPQYWQDVSPITFFDRATEPLLLIHGGDDDTTLPEWSEQTAEAWRAAGNESEAIIIEGADHALAPARNEVANIVVEAFDTVLAPGL